MRRTKETLRGILFEKLWCGSGNRYSAFHAITGEDYIDYLSDAVTKALGKMTKKTMLALCAENDIEVKEE